MPQHVLRGRRTRTPLTSRSLAVRAAGTIVAGAAVFAAPAAAQASVPAPIVVPCSSSALVSAIHQANSAGPAILLLSRGCNYVLTSAVALAEGLPPVTGHLVISGSGGTTISRSSSTAFRILHVAPGGRLTLANVTVANGNVSPGIGGGIEDEGSLVLRNVRLTGNTSDSGGGLFVGSGADARISSSELDRNDSRNGAGGAIDSRGDLVIDRSILTRNTSVGGGGVFTSPGATTRISRTVIIRNSARNTPGAGGGILNEGAIVLTGDRVVLNDAVNGGGIANFGSATLRFTLVAFNTPDNCFPRGSTPGCRH
ncbi:MAG TPA: hypothetical protein VGQ05_09235 [Streptosporangiaceae bacterium]|jgi:hypothetical protein|nr:hypothetical protein [Streptosporangiaceae bacterium]